jgi:hypothetical protein
MSRRANAASCPKQCDVDVNTTLVRGSMGLRLVSRLARSIMHGDIGLCEVPMMLGLAVKVSYGRWLGVSGLR